MAASAARSPSPRTWRARRWWPSSATASWPSWCPSAPRWGPARSTSASG